jgi:hypothetical protein
MAKAYTLPASEEGHHAPPRTIMQGSVDDGFDGGYEERDVQFKPLFAWSAAILVMALGTMVFVWGYMAFMLDMMEKEEAALPPVMVQPQTPPAPRLLPNVIDEGPRMRAHEPLQMPWEFGGEERVAAKAKAAEHGLWDKDTGLPNLPKESIDAVMRSAGGAPAPSSATFRPRMDGTNYDLPSDSSGGLRMENRLK